MGVQSLILAGTILQAENDCGLRVDGKKWVDMWDIQILKKEVQQDLRTGWLVVRGSGY